MTSGVGFLSYCCCCWSSGFLSPLEAKSLHTSYIKSVATPAAPIMAPGTSSVTPETIVVAVSIVIPLILSMHSSPSARQSTPHYDVPSGQYPQHTGPIPFDPAGQGG